MSDQQQGPVGGGLFDLISTIKGGVQNLSLVAQAFSTAFPRITGSFTLSAATTTVVTEPKVVASSIVQWFPTNATGALIVRTNGLYHATNTAGATFTMSTQLGSATSSGPFNYVIINPV